MKQNKLYVFLSILIMLIGIIVAFTCEIDTSIIYDDSIGTVPVNIGMHVFVVMLFVLASSWTLYLFFKNKTNNSLYTKHYSLLGGYLISGLLFSVASGCQARAHHLFSFYSSMGSAPSWYASEFKNAPWFDTLPDAANRFSTIATTLYILMFIAVVITAILAKRASSD